MCGNKILVVVMCFTVLSEISVSDPNNTILTPNNTEAVATTDVLSTFKMSGNEKESADPKVTTGKREPQKVATSVVPSSDTIPTTQNDKVTLTEKYFTDSVTSMATETTTSYQVNETSSELASFKTNVTPHETDSFTTYNISRAFAAEFSTSQKAVPAQSDTKPTKVTSQMLTQTDKPQENVTSSAITSEKISPKTSPSLMETTPPIEMVTSLASTEIHITNSSGLPQVNVSVDEKHTQFTTSVEVSSAETIALTSTTTSIFKSSVTTSNSSTALYGKQHNPIPYMYIILIVCILLPVVFLLIVLLIIRKRRQRGFQSFTSSHKKKKRTCEDAWAGPVPMPDDSSAPDEAAAGKGTDVPTKRLSLSTFFAKRKSRPCSVVLEEVNTQNAPEEKETLGDTTQPLLSQNANDNIQGNSPSMQSNGQVNKEAAGAHKDTAVPNEDIQAAIPQANGQADSPVPGSSDVSGENLEELPPPPPPTSTSEEDSLPPPPPAEENINQNASSTSCVTASF